MERVTIRRLPHRGEKFSGRIVAGWSRTPTTAPSIKMPDGWYTDVAIKFTDYSEPVYAVLVSKEPL